jgi:hypothetical protein
MSGGRIVVALGFALAMSSAGCGATSEAGAKLDAAPDDASQSPATDAASIGTVGDAGFVVRSESAMQWGTYSMAVGLTTEARTECGPVHEDGWAIALYILADPSPITPGTYPLGTTDGGVVVDACLHAYGPDCGVPATEGGPGCSFQLGQITLTSISDRVTGAFDVVVGGEHLAGPFDAVLCGPDAGAGVLVLDSCK